MESLVLIVWWSLCSVGAVWSVKDAELEGAACGAQHGSTRN